MTGLRIYFDLCDDYDTLLVRSFHDEDCDGIPVSSPAAISRPRQFLRPARPDRIPVADPRRIHNVRRLFPYDGVVIPLTVVHTGEHDRAYPGDTFRARLAPALCWTTAPLEEE